MVQISRLLLIGLLLAGLCLSSAPGWGGGGGTPPTSDPSGSDPGEDPPQEEPGPDPQPDPDPVTPSGSCIDHGCTLLSAMPSAAIQAAQSSLHIVYQHTSHGSQLITGMNALASFPAFGSDYAGDDAGATPGALDLDDYGIPACEDLSQGDWEDTNGDTPWVVATRALLDDPGNAHVNVVVWSWCSINGHDAQRYVDNMEKLVAEYPAVAFVFTGPCRAHIRRSAGTAGLAAEPVRRLRRGDVRGASP